jgi:hypothetical protein
MVLAFEEGTYSLFLSLYGEAFDKRILKEQ